MIVNFKYYEENLKKVIENPNSVLFIKPYEIGNQKSLYAVVKEEDGVYRRLCLTEKMNKNFFPIEPLCYLKNGPLYFHLKNYIGFSNYIALNMDNLDSFCSEDLKGKIFNTAIFGVFNDGSSVFIKRTTKHAFKREGGIQTYNDLLELYKEVKMHDESYSICFPENSNVAVIPELQNDKGKKLTLN